jgi:hypothetical protein
MSTEAAWTVLVAVAAAGAVFWVITAIGFVRLVRPRREEVPFDLPLSRHRGVEGPTGDRVVTGHVEVQGRPEDLSQRLAEALGRTGLSGLLTRVVERTNDRVVFEVLGPSLGHPTGGTSPTGDSSRPIRGEVVFSPCGSNRCRGHYAIEAGTGRGLVVAGTVVLVAGLVVLVTLFLCLRFYVVNSAEPGIRAQAVQMIQCVHLIWPPWLLGVLYRRGQVLLSRALEVLIGNLPYL